MSTTDELGIIDNWLHATLTSDTTLAALVGARVFDSLATKQSGGKPQPMPYIIFNLQAPGNDVIAVGNYRIYSHALYTVRAVGVGSGYGVVQAIVAGIDAALHGKRATTTYGVVLDCHRERPLKLPPEQAAGEIIYWSAGGIYRIMAKAV